MYNEPVVIEVSNEFVEPITDDSNHKTDEEIAQIENDLRSKSLEQSPSEKLVIESTKIGLNNLRNNLGLEKIPLDTIEVLFLNEGNFKKAYQDITGEDEVCAVACASGSLHPVLIQESNNRDYYIGSIVFHELVHKYIDLNVDAKAKTDAEPIVESRRSGMSIQNISTRTNIGEIINELGNYACQSGFISSILKLDDYKWELEEKNQLIKALGFDPRNFFFPAVINDKILEKPIQIIYEKKNIHFNKDKEILWGELASLMMQLESDLNVVCGDIEGKTFGNFLIECKRDPRKQNILRKVVDEKVSQGFYRKLREYEQIPKNIVAMMHEVQEKRYGEKLSQK